MVRSNETSDSDISTDGLTTELKTLEISSSRRDDESFLSPTSGSLFSSTSDEGIAAKPATSEPRKRLNEYLTSKGIAPITQPWLEWDKASDSTIKATVHQTIGRYRFFSPPHSQSE